MLDLGAYAQIASPSLSFGVERRAVFTFLPMFFNALLMARFAPAFIGVEPLVMSMRERVGGAGKTWQ
jgi:hypothetical protein